MPTIAPFLTFDKNAEEAVDFYLSVFPGSRKIRTSYTIEGHTSDPNTPAGDVLTVEFEILGQRYIALNGGPRFKFSNAVSFLVECETQEEIDRYWSALTTDGGEEVQCGWLTDKFGLSWQITPKVMLDYLYDDDRAATKRAFDAMGQMVKLDIANLEKAFQG